MLVKNGDTIGITALAGVCNNDDVQAAVFNLQNLGFNIKLSSNVYDENNYLAGDDDEKLSQISKFFSDSDIKFILNARGGYGGIRLINNINYDIIRNNPKPFVGYSDITALLLMIYKKTGITTYHGPMALSDYADINDPAFRFTHEHLLKALSGEPLNFIGNKLYGKNRKTTEGIIWGGNLSTVVSLCGQDFIPDEDFIFFAEDLNEPVYKIDKMFTQLFNIPEFKDKCKGVVLGDFINVDNEEWLEDLFYSFECPTAGGFKITHNAEKITVPIGRWSVLDGMTLTITGE